ncbi:MAG: sulfotransferase [Synechococcaceae cyanobacterium SM2_3_1]|nr:sulfotransferase [Synechococcaceae cyanobacterium SM2_3_1]
MFHPLLGCDLWTLVRILKRNGFVPLKQVPYVTLMATASLLRSPFSVFETLLVSRSHTITAQMPDPIFIIGHWRSGTTFLYNLLSQAPHFAYVSPIATGLPWDFLTLATLLRPLLERALPQDRRIDQVTVQPDSPQEDEIGLANMQPLSYYHGLYFPRHFHENFQAGIFLEGCPPDQVEEWKRALIYFCQKLYLQQRQRLIIKNPVYTARVALLRSIWPQAKFIHIHRNPYIVFQSMKKFYRVLFQELALQPYDLSEIDTVILETYPRMMNQMFEETADLPAHQFIELRFDQFESDPLSQIHHIYTQLELDDFETANSCFTEYLQSQASYRKNCHSFSSESIELVQQYWQPFIERWHYEIPA